MQYHELYKKCVKPEGRDFIFNNLISTLFAKTGLKNKDSLEHTEEYDLSKTYIPNHACIWNRTQNIGRPCAILVKDTRFALIGFIGEDLENSCCTPNIYRLEDLSLKNSAQFAKNCIIEGQ